MSRQGDANRARISESSLVAGRALTCLPAGPASNTRPRVPLKLAVAVQVATSTHPFGQTAARYIDVVHSGAENAGRRPLCPSMPPGGSV